MAPGVRPRQRATRVSQVGQADAFLAKAEQFLEVAREALMQHRFDAALLLAVHAGISASDAAAVFLVGSHSRSRDHLQAVTFLERAAGGSGEVRARARQLRSLIEFKAGVEYQHRPTIAADAQRGVAQASRFVEWASALIRGRDRRPEREHER